VTLLHSSLGFQRSVGRRSWLGGVCTWRDMLQWEMASGFGWLGAVIAR